MMSTNELNEHKKNVMLTFVTENSENVRIRSTMDVKNHLHLHFEQTIINYDFFVPFVSFVHFSSTNLIIGILRLYKKKN